jgi:hypothetical protein
MEKIWKESHSIADYYNTKHFKSYDDLKAKYEKVMFGGSTANSSSGSMKPKSAEDMINEMTSGSSTSEAKAPQEKSAPLAGKSAPAAPVSHSSDVDSELELFEKMLAGTA